ncbi:MAG: PAS domain S-box protein [Burkholderiaceae bacterium]
MQPTDIALDSEPADLDYLFGVAELTRLSPGLMQALEQQVFIAATAVNAAHGRLQVHDQLGGQLTAHWPPRQRDRRSDGLRLVLDRLGLRPLEGSEPVHAQVVETIDGPRRETVDVIRVPVSLGERLLRAELSLVSHQGNDQIDPAHPVLRAAIALIQQSLVGTLRHLADTRRLAAMYLASPALLYFLDGSGNIVAASDLWLRHFGYRREDVIGRNARNFMTRQSRQAFMKVRTGLWRSGGCRDYPCQFRQAERRGGRCAAVGQYRIRPARLADQCQVFAQRCHRVAAPATRARVRSAARLPDPGGP